MVIASARPVLVFAALLGASVWIGGFVAIVVVARVARQKLERPVMVAFFRAFGRAYLVVGCVGLALGLGAGGALLSSHRFDGLVLATVLVAAALVLALILGVAQARAMTRLRSRMLASPGESAVVLRVKRGASQAAALRGMIGVLSLALLALSAVLTSVKG